MIIPLEKFWSVFTHTPCDEQREIVEKEWPVGIPLCSETVQRALDLRLDLNWIAMYLPESFQGVYDFKTAPIWHEFNKKCALIYREYDEKYTQIQHKYDEKSASIWREYNEKHTLIRHEFNKKIALILLEILNTIFR